MLSQKLKDRDSSPVAQIADIAAMLRVLRPLDQPGTDSLDTRRRLLADLCKFIAVKLGTLPPAALGFAVSTIESTVPAVPPAVQAPLKTTEPPSVAVETLAPRLRQTLACLLEGDSEKQVAYKLKLSKHTVHVYVKSLYRKFNVNSRAELMSRHLKR